MPYLRCPCHQCKYPALVNERTIRKGVPPVCPRCGNLLYMPSCGGKRGNGQKCPVCGRYTWIDGKCTSCGGYYEYRRK